MANKLGNQMRALAASPIALPAPAPSAVTLGGTPHWNCTAQ